MVSLTTVGESAQPILHGLVDNVSDVLDIVVLNANAALHLFVEVIL